MTLFGMRRGQRKLLALAVIAGLILTLTPMSSQAGSVSPLQWILEFAKVKKNKKQVSCPQLPCCLSGACCPQGVCCPAGGCCDQFKCCPQTAACPLGVSLGAAALPYCQGQCPAGDVVFQSGQAGKHVQFELRIERPITVQGGAIQLQGKVVHVLSQGNVLKVVHQQSDAAKPAVTPLVRFTPDRGTPITCCPVAPTQAYQALSDRKVTISFNNVPVSDCLQALRHYVGNINILIDDAAIKQASVNLRQPVTMNLTDLSLGSVLNHLLKKVDATFVINNGSILVTSMQAAHASTQAAPTERETRIYCVDGLLEMISTLQSQQAARAQARTQNELTLFQTGFFAAVSGSICGTCCPAVSVPDIVRCQACNVGCTQKPEDYLINLVKKSLPPCTWCDAGGKATIQYFPLGKALVVGQATPEMHEKIICVLNVLRELQACGLVSKPTCAAASCATCPATCDQCPSAGTKVVIRIVKPEQCGVMQFVPFRVNPPEHGAASFQCVPTQVSSTCDAVVKKHTDELERLCAEYQRTIRELQETAKSLQQEVTSLRQSRDLENCVRDLQQDLYNLRQEVHMSRMQQTFAPTSPYNVQPASMPSHPMAPTFFFMPAGSAYPGMPTTAPNGDMPYLFRIPR